MARSLAALSSGSKSPQSPQWCEGAEQDGRKAGTCLLSRRSGQVQIGVAGSRMPWWIRFWGRFASVVSWVLFDCQRWVRKRPQRNRLITWIGVNRRTAETHGFAPPPLGGGACHAQAYTPKIILVLATCPPGLAIRGANLQAGEGTIPKCPTSTSTGASRRKQTASNRHEAGR
jgi:hypothetical protein